MCGIDYLNSEKFIELLYLKPESILIISESKVNTFINIFYKFIKITNFIRSHITSKKIFLEDFSSKEFFFIVR